MLPPKVEIWLAAFDICLPHGALRLSFECILSLIRFFFLYPHMGLGKCDCESSTIGRID